MGAEVRALPHPSRGGEQDVRATISQLREKMQSIESGGGVGAGSGGFGGGFSGGVTAAEISGAGAAEAPQWLAPHMLGGGFARGAVTQVSACPTAVVDILASLTAAGGCAAVVNYPRLALAAVVAAGGDLERLVIVPDASQHAAAVVATLAEGMDMVVFNAAADANARGELHSGFTLPVDARVHKSSCALLVSGAAWPSARHHVDVAVHGVHGLGRGSGRVRSVELRGRVWGKAQPPQRFQAIVGQQLGVDHASAVRGVRDAAERVAQ